MSFFNSVYLLLLRKKIINNGRKINYSIIVISVFCRMNDSPEMISSYLLYRVSAVKVHTIEIVCGEIKLLRGCVLLDLIIRLIKKKKTLAGWVVVNMSIFFSLFTKRAICIDKFKWTLFDQLYTHNHSVHIHILALI